MSIMESRHQLWNLDINFGVWTSIMETLDIIWTSFGQHLELWTPIFNIEIIEIIGSFWTSFGHHLGFGHLSQNLDINKTRDRPTDRPSYGDAWTHLKMRHCGTKDLRHDSIADKDRHHHLLLLILSLFKERTADSRHLHY